MENTSNKKTEISIESNHNFISLIKFALPTIIMMIVSGFYSVVDSIFISNFIGTDALSSVNIIFPVIYLIVGFAVMLSSGSNAIVANKIGQKKQEEAREDFTLIVLVTIIVGIIITIFGIAFIKAIIYGLGSNDLLYPYGRDYLLVILIFTVPYMLQLIFQIYYITDGKPQLGLILTLIGGGLNIILDYIFIEIFNLEVLGAGLATGIGSLVTSLYGIYYFYAKSETLKFKKTRFKKDILISSCLNGSSEMISNLAVGITTFLFNIIFLKRLGEDGVAAITIILYVQYLMITIFLGFSLGVSPVISYNYGAKNKEQLNKIYKICLYFVVFSSILMYGLSYIFKTELISIFIDTSHNVYGIASNGFRIFSISFLFVGLNIFSSTFFTSLGNGIISGIISISHSFIFLVIGLLIFPNIFDVNGVWMSVPFAEIITFFISIFFLKYGKKHYDY